MHQALSVHEGLASLTLDDLDPGHPLGVKRAFGLSFELFALEPLEVSEGLGAEVLGVRGDWSGPEDRAGVDRSE